MFSRACVKLQKQFQFSKTNRDCITTTKDLSLFFPMSRKLIKKLNIFYLFPISKLKHHRVRGVKKECFCSYLKSSKQFVSVYAFVSNTKHICTGVLQGSVLGPLLFLIYIHDLHTCTKYSKTYHFCDDTNILYCNKSFKYWWKT